MHSYEPIIALFGNGIGVRSIDFSVYSDNAPLLKPGGEYNPKDIEALLVRPRTMGEFMTAMFFVDACRYRGHQIPKLVLPFFPGARQDRLNPTGDYLFTAKSVAEIINSKGFETVVVLDPHSDVVPALVNNCRVVTMLHPFMEAHLVQPDFAAVVAPDAGAAKRAGLVANAMGKPLIHAWKTRDIKTGELTGFGHQPIDPEITKHVKKLLVVDDICDGGGTFMGLGEVLKDEGYDIELFITHGIFSKGTRALGNVFDKIYTTDSLAIRQDPWVTVVPICEKLLKFDC